MKKGSPRRDLFPKEFVVDFNATAAAKRCGYSKKTARQQGSALLSNMAIQKAIRELMQKRQERLEISADRVLQEIALIAYLDPADIYNQEEGGALTMKTFEEMGVWRRAISEIKEDRIIKEVRGDKNTPDGEMILNDKRSLKFHDKTGSLRTLCEHLGILKNQLPTLPQSLTVIIERRKPAGGSGA